MDTRRKRVQWGTGKPRSRTSTEYWKQPLRWNKEAQANNTTYRVFCASFADVFDQEVPEQWRRDLFNLIQQTQHLTWLILTKRPQHMLDFIGCLKTELEYDNVWFGVSVENQETADERIPFLLDIPVRRLFLSCEPLLGPLNLLPYLPSNKISWVITGGESGPGYRPAAMDWFEMIRWQCWWHTVPFFHKQNGGNRKVGGAWGGRKIYNKIYEETPWQEI